MLSLLLTISLTFWHGSDMTLSRIDGSASAPRQSLAPLLNDALRWAEKGDEERARILRVLGKRNAARLAAAKAEAGHGSSSGQTSA